MYLTNVRQWITQSIRSRSIPGVLAYVVRKGGVGEDTELLLVRSRSSPQHFHFPSGTIRPFESADNAVHRELYEETLLRVPLEAQTVMYTFRYKTLLLQPRSTQIVYTGSAPFSAQAQASNEIIELRWATLDQARSLVYPDLVAVIDQVCKLAKS